MNLLIVESPSKAKTINKYLGKDFNVISSYGHIRGLPSQKDAVLPEKNFEMNYVILSPKHAKNIIKEAKKSNAIYLATDPDREGEAISWHILKALEEAKAIKKDTPIYRVIFYEITKSAILNAVSSPKQINFDLVDAQKARQALDYLVGFNLSPVLWRKLPGSRSAGRVQSVALKAIYDRDLEIKQFIEKEYWSILGIFRGDAKLAITASLSKYDGKKIEKFSIQDEADAKERKKILVKKSYNISSVTKKMTSRKPSAPFTTSTMLQEATRHFGFSAKRTSSVAQSLYEGVDISSGVVGLITYMRTDSVSMSSQAVSQVRDVIKSQYGPKYLPEQAAAYKTKTRNAQEAHEAIRPTDFSLSPDSIKDHLSPEQYKLYSLIYKRALASQMNPSQTETITAIISDDSKQWEWKATGSHIIFDGFRKLYIQKDDDLSQNDERKPESANLHNLKEGQKVTIAAKDIELLQHFTQPPPRYTEATLIKKMEELGIGRPSTYPSVISVLQEREYVTLDKKRFFTTPRGYIVSTFLENYFPTYIRYDFTSDLEGQLDDISNGNAKMNDVLQGFWDGFESKIAEVMEYSPVDIIKNIEEKLENYLFSKEEIASEKKCHQCKNGTMSLKAGKFGAFIGCDNYPECNYTKKIEDCVILSSKGERDQGAEGKEGAEVQLYPKNLGEVDGKTITIKKGPYGPYIQSDKEEQDIKRASIPKDIKIENIDLDYAIKMLSLPREVGLHTKTKKPILSGIGRYGSYIKYNNIYVSIKSDNPVTIDLERAIEIIASSKKIKDEDK